MESVQLLRIIIKNTEHIRGGVRNEHEKTGDAALVEAPSAFRVV